MTDAKKYWDEYYLENADSKVNSFVEQMMPRLQKGRVLDVAMGAGANAIFLAKNGFDVMGFDISPVALEKANKKAEKESVEIETKCTDLDMFLLDLMAYDTIVMTDFKPALVRFYAELIRSLKQGGTLLISSYGVADMDEALSKKESYKNMYYHSNEILKNLNGLKILFYQEAEIDGRHVVQCLAEKPLDKDAIKYDLFDMYSKSAKTPEKSKHLELAESLFKK